MFREQYKKINESIYPTREMVNKVKGFSKESKKTYRIYKVAAVLMGIILVGSSIPVLANHVEPFYEVMYAISPEITQNMVSVRKSCESNGIQMDVLSAKIDGNTADIYIAMRDLAGDRIDETMDLNDSYSIKSKYSTAATCNLVEYQEDTKTAVFGIHIEQNKGRSIDKEKITFSIKNFMSAKKEHQDIELLKSIIEEEVETSMQYLTGTSGNFDEPRGDKQIFLKPIQQIKTKVEDMWISGAGYVEDKFHIQLAIKDKLQTDTHGEVYLKNEEGEVITSEAVNYYRKGEGENRIDYQEYIFDLPKEKTQDYKVYGSFITSGKYTEGNWKVVFDV